jgi:hypothetical protein
MASLMRLAVLGLVLTMVPVACLQEYDDDDCERACEVLESCDLLPSALGVGDDGPDAEDNCQPRCEQSESNPRERVLACTRASECSEVKACLDAEFPGYGFAGEGGFSGR